MTLPIQGQIENPQAFVIMPFDEPFRDFYQLVIKGACENASVDCTRVDEQHIPDHIVETIYKNIRDADLIIADLTGANANVYYELGYAKAHGKRIIPLTQTFDDLKFDFRAYNVYKYDPRNLAAFKDDLKHLIVDHLRRPPTGFDILGVYDKSADLQTVMGEFLCAAKETVMFSGAHFAISASDRRKELLSLLSQGVDITYHVIDPSSKAVMATAKAFGMRDEELKKECVTGIEILKGLAEEANSLDATGAVKVYLAQESPQARYMLFDHGLDRGKVVVTPYVDGLRSSHTPSYVFRSQASVSQTYVRCCLDAVLRSKKVDILSM